MKLTAILLCMALMTISTLAHSQKLTISGEKMPLEKLFTTIKKQTGYTLLYTKEMLQKTKPVSLALKAVELPEALKLIFTNQPLTYSIIDQTIVIKQLGARPSPVLETDSVYGFIISGKVTNSQGMPIAGANISVKKGRGTITNEQGLFTLERLNKFDVIVISHVGYLTQQKMIDSKQSLTVVMQEANNRLDAVIVQGYGVTSERTTTGNISKVTAEDIAKQPVINPLQILQGRVPGAAVTNVSGYSSGSLKIEIRGRNNIDPKMVAEPLYIVDGVPLTTLNLTNVETIAAGSAVSQGVIQSGIASPAGGQSPFYNINPSDIESIEILKDGDATAIYGSRAANGVILVTTKKGKAGKTATELQMYTGITKITRFYPLLNTKQYVALRKAALQNDGLPINIMTAPDLVAWDTTRYTDWQRYVYGGTGRVLNAQLSLSGGNASTNFRTSAGYHYEKDLTAISGGNNRGSFAITLQHKTPRQKFIIDASAQYSVSSIDLINPSGSALLPPNAPPIFNAEGKLNYAGWAPLTTSFTFSSMLQPYNAETRMLNSNLVLTYTITKGLSAKVNLGYNHSVNKQTVVMPIASLNPDANPKGSRHAGYSFFHNVISEPQIEYNTFLGGGKLLALAGATYQNNNTSGVLNTGSNYSSDLLLRSLNAAPIKLIAENEAFYKYAGAFVRLNYNYQNKYIINLNGRRDGSSRFGYGRQFGNFGSVGGAWIFSEEDFMKENILFSFGKMRVSYGLTGSDQIGDYAYLPLWGFNSPGQYGGNRPIFPTRFSDSLLHWEVNRKLEVAFQLGFLKDRLNIQVSYYRNRCNNQLIQLPVGSQAGFELVSTNVPANVQNRGMEYQVSATAIARQSWQLTTRFNIAINRNKLLSYPNFDQSPYKGRFVVGMPLNIQKYLHFTGVDPQTGEYNFADITKDGKITFDLTGNTVDDRLPINMTPEFEGGFGADLSYKQWSLSFLFFFRKQKGFNALMNAEQPGSRSNQPLDVMNYWKVPGDIVPVGKPLNYPTSNSFNYSVFSDARISDASFLRLQNLSLNWNLPVNWIQQLKLENVRFYLQGENLLLITGYKGADPEIQQFGSMPRPAFITAGISCKL